MTEQAVSASAAPVPSLGLALTGNPPTVQATRLGDVPQGFWLQLLGEWGSDGDRPGERVLLPLERLLSNMAWLRMACQRYGVGIVSTPDLDSILQQTRAQRRLLQSALATPQPLDHAAVAGRLTGTRFSRQLRTFQIRDLGRLLGLANGANFSVPGAGKTTVAYAVYESERAAGRVEQMLVVAPLWRGSWTGFAEFDEARADQRDVIAAGRLLREDGAPGAILLADDARIAYEVQGVGPALPVQVGRGCLGSRDSRTP
mgnify:CR=1 FL=1